MNDDEQARAMAAFSANTLGLRDIAVVVDAETGYGNDLAYAFIHSLPSYVRTYRIDYHTGETRFAREVARLKNTPSTASTARVMQPQAPTSSAP